MADAVDMKTGADGVAAVPAEQDIDQFVDELALMPESRRKQMKAVVRRWRLMSPEARREVSKAVEDRMRLHLMQEPTAELLTGDIIGGNQFFGVEMMPRTIDEPFWMQSVYVIAEHVAKDGLAKALCVCLRCWEDWGCKTAIELNKSMVARVCADRKLNFSTRMQTDVQTRTVIMWMRLRGKFFWNRDNKVNAANLYFDDRAKILRVVHSDDFKGWLHAHTQINPAKADFDFLMHQIDAAAMNSRIASECVPGALFDRRGNVVYVSNGDAMMVRVSAAKGKGKKPVVELVSNGTDNVVFTQGMTLKPWQLLDGEGEDPFETCPPFSTANYQSEHGRMIARLWFLGLASCLRSYPAIVFTGKMRSGKSRTAKGVFELLGAPVRLSAIRANGESDFWTVVNKGGVVCFDNVDTKNVWFGDAMQLACTDGSTEARTLFTNDQTTTLRANAKIIMTSNNPMFASESGLADRLQIVRLDQFDGKNGKESGDTAITEAIDSHRNSALTWMVKTVSRALADTDEVEPNVNMRHPDFAAFSMRCARALSDAHYRMSILALKSAEFDKALLTVQNNSTTNYIFEALCAHFTDEEKMRQEWDGTASDLMAAIVEIHPDLEKSKYLSATSIGKAMSRYFDQLAVLFDMKPPRKYGSQTKFLITGFSDMYAKNVNISKNFELKTDDSAEADVSDLL